MYLSLVQESITPYTKCPGNEAVAAETAYRNASSAIEIVRIAADVKGLIEYAMVRRSQIICSRMRPYERFQCIHKRSLLPRRVAQNRKFRLPPFRSSTRPLPTRKRCTVPSSSTPTSTRALRIQTLISRQTRSGCLRLFRHRRTVTF